jgi:cyclopropane-fatty-acyl-phospholipid synthase
MGTMKKDGAESIVRGLLEEAGLTLNGDQSFDIQVHDERFYRRVLGEGALGLGESYMDEWWDCRAIDQFIDKILRARTQSRLKGNWQLAWHALKAKIFNLQSPSRSYRVGEEHYDIGNDLFRAMLDTRMNYSCGYWKNAVSLDEAQEAKLDLICRKLNLRPGMTILEFGCGWGAFARYAAERYGVEVRGVTVSREQVDLGRKVCEGLPVEIDLMDYRKVTGRYDRVISIGFFEHVGRRNYPSYMKKLAESLKDDGIAFTHTIGDNISTASCNPWITKYIFPGGMFPSIAQIGRSIEGILVMEDWHNFGEDYDRTLMAWHANFESAWPRLKEKYDQRFYRMWRFYLLSSAAAFRSRTIQLWQIVMTRPGITQPDCRII